MVAEIVSSNFIIVVDRVEGDTQNNNRG